MTACMLAHSDEVFLAADIRRKRRFLVGNVSFLAKLGTVEAVNAGSGVADNPVAVPVNPASHQLYIGLSVKECHARRWLINTVFFCVCRWRATQEKGSRYCDPENLTDTDDAPAA